MKKTLLLFVLMLFMVNCSYAVVFNGTDVHLDEDVCINETVLVEDKLVVESANNNTLTVNSSRGFDITPSGDLTLIGLTVTGAHNSAIANSGKLTLINCTFISNKGIYGGAIYNDGELTVENCIFNSNTVSANGGAIYNAASYVNITDSSFISNKAFTRTTSVNGGAIYNLGDRLLIKNCTFDLNCAYNTDWYKNGPINGGALYSNASSILVQSSKFTKNYVYGMLSTNSFHLDLSRKQGGAICSFGDNNYFISNLIDESEIYTLFPSYDYEKIYGYSSFGSAMYLDGNFYLSDNIISNSKSAKSAVYIRNMYNSSINDNVFKGNYARQGNGIDISIYYANNIEIKGNDFSNASVNLNDSLNHYYDYSIIITSGDNINFTYNLIKDNGVQLTHHTEFGGELNSNLNISNNVFSDTFIGLDLNAPINAAVFNNQFINNGVGIMAGKGNGESKSRNLNITNNYFKGNIVERPYAYPTGVSLGSIDNSLVKGNVFDGMYVEGKSIVSVSSSASDNFVPNVLGNYFINNIVGEGGSIISLNTFDTYANIQGNFFSNNTYTTQNSAVISTGGSSAYVIENIFADKHNIIFQNQYPYYCWDHLEGKDNKIADYNGELGDYYDLTSNSFVDLRNTASYSQDSSENTFNNINNIIEDIANLFNDYISMILNPIFNNPPAENRDDNVGGEGNGNGTGEGDGNGNGTGEGNGTDLSGNGTGVNMGNATGNETGNGTEIGIGSGNGTGVGNGTGNSTDIGDITGNGTDATGNSTGLENQNEIKDDIDSPSINTEEIEDKSNNSKEDKPITDPFQSYDEIVDNPNNSSSDTETKNEVNSTEENNQNTNVVEEIIENITDVIDNVTEEITRNITINTPGEESSEEISQDTANTLVSNEESYESTGFTSVGEDSPSNNLGGDSSTSKSSQASASESSSSPSESSQESQKSYEISKDPVKQISTENIVLTIILIVIVCFSLFIGFIRKNNE